MPTRTWVMAPLVAALAKAEALLGGAGKWKEANRDQSRFLALHFEPNRQDLPEIPEIKAAASRSAQDINRFLADNGFPEIKLDGQGSGGVYAAAVLDLIVNWLAKGRVGQIKGKDGKFYAAIVMSSKDNGVGFFRINLLDCVCAVVEIPTKEGDKVSMVIPPRIIDPEIDEVGRMFAGSFKGLPKGGDLQGCDELAFPMISLDGKDDIGWLRGMSTLDEKRSPAVIAQAFQRTRLRVDQFGARAQSAAGLGLFGSAVSVVPSRLTIDSPFFFLVHRDGIKQPLFVGYLDYDCWSDPGSLLS